MWSNILDEAKQRKLKELKVKEIVDAGSFSIRNNKLYFFVDKQAQKIGGKTTARQMQLELKNIRPATNYTKSKGDNNSMQAM